MTQTDRIVADWLTRADTRAVMAALEAARPGGARFVGGCVRNDLRGMQVDDIDIATQLVPAASIAALQAAGIRVIETGVDHGTVTAILDGRPFEITSLRRDVETDGRRAVVAFTEDWSEDAQRRDFRMNAIYADADGRLHEIVPGSIADAVAGRVVFIGDGDQRLVEDYLRALRFFRFNAWYGAAIDPEGLAACARQKDGLRKIAAERIWKEFRKTLAAPDPSDAMLAMEESGVLEIVLPGASASALPALVALERAHALAPDPMRRLMALVPRRMREMTALAGALRLSNDETARLTAWADPALGHVLSLSAPRLRAALYEYGAGAVTDRAILDAAASGDSGLAEALKSATGWTRPDFPLRGDDALALGLEGPKVGAALRTAEAAWIASDFQLGRDQLLETLRRAGSQTG